MFRHTFRYSYSISDQQSNSADFVYYHHPVLHDFEEAYCYSSQLSDKFFMTESPYQHTSLQDIPCLPGIHELDFMTNQAYQMQNNMELRLDPFAKNSTLKKNTSKRKKPEYFRGTASIRVNKEQRKHQCHSCHSTETPEWRRGPLVWRKLLKKDEESISCLDDGTKITLYDGKKVL
ncbi:hypothetical protein BD560DRAFT_428254 [Blakeslea trispora]|nr:hypothetical protein BD560DRAFT_428254 [Blakeslea trispora]